MKYEGLLPIGSVVRLKEMEHDVMVTGYAMRRQEENGSVLYDYSGCPHPQGVIGPDKTILFNQESIREIFAMGYLDGTTILYLGRAEEELTRLRKGENNG